MIRLQKFLADNGVASRRASEKLIVDGKVKVDGLVVTTLGTKIDPNVNQVQVQNKKIKIDNKKIYYLLYKPTGYVSTTHDELGRKNVLELLPPTHTRLYPVGRLDVDTSGLLIVTNDGALTQALTHPKHKIKKVYEALIEGTPTARELKRFREGLSLAHRRTAPAEIEIIKNNDQTSLARISLFEGRYHQVRRMCQAINHPVLTLKRTALGTLNLGTLASGEYRLLSSEEIKSFL